MLTFDDFRKKAKNENLKSHQKVGRGDIHVKQDNLEKNIFPDVQNKLNIKPGMIICDIGCGCSTPVLDLIRFSEKNNNNLILIDCKEMLDLLPDAGFIEKIPSEFPSCSDFIEEYKGGVDYIITYSVVQVLFVHGDMFGFIDQAVTLLKSGGRMLIGDLPNLTKKKRFLSSEAGIKFHQEWSGTKEIPQVDWARQEGDFDEEVVFSILQRYRQKGCEAYLLEQPDGLPLNKTREDILIVKL